MGQATKGARSVLSFPWIYNLWRTLVGGKSASVVLVERYLRVEPGDAVLDIGCGTASVLAHLPEGVDYTGFDQSEDYVEAARTRFGSRGTFLQGTVGEPPPGHWGGFDLAIALGVVHHLDDDEAMRLFTLARETLKPDGRLVTLDGVFDDTQSTFARKLLSWDRGKHLRYKSGYEALARRHFDIVDAEVRHDLLRLPYTHIIMTCSQPKSDVSSQRGARPAGILKG